jgi:topoisomerase-4 subunit A
MIDDEEIEEINNSDELSDDGINSEEAVHNILHVNDFYKDWFLEYASYVILDRAVPYLSDGLKPVQRRILHSMRRMEDGRYNKVANIIGHTMQFHPHGDMSIGGALVGLGQKELLIDSQGNWGNILTGDGAAAPRYIEARLSKFALEVAFNPKTTEWKASYDGRNKEPIALPMKFPLLLAQGVEGIAVGLATIIMPHNFNELLDASIAHLRNEDFEIYPDFPTGGFIDCSKYKEGLRGGQLKIRARINKLDNKTLVITEIPYGKTTDKVIESIIKANDKGKIKIKKIDDNTSSNVEIVIHLAPGISPDETIDALYVFTDCETPVSPNSCVIIDKKPHFLSVKEILRRCTDFTVYLLKLELEIRLNELAEDWHKTSLEKIFILNKVYLVIEESKNEDEMFTRIEEGLKPFIKKLKRAVTHDDIVRLTTIQIKRISRYSSFEADNHIKNIEAEMLTVQANIDTIIQFTIDYFNHIKTKYGKGRERKTEIRNFETIDASEVAIANTKFYGNLIDGFIGTSLKKDQFLFDCSDIDDVIVFLDNGKYVVTKVSDKAFIGKNIMHIAIFRKNDERTVYNTVYSDGATGITFMKRFFVTNTIRDKEYDITQGTNRSKLLYFSANPNGEAEKIRIWLKPRPKLKKTIFDVDFKSLAIKGRQSMGNVVSKNPIHKVKKIEEGFSTLGGIKIWFDTVTRRLNQSERGQFIGEFKGAERILVVSKTGKYTLMSFDLSNHFDEDLYVWENDEQYIEKFKKGKILSLIYFDAEQNYYYLKRFELEETDKWRDLIGEHPNSKLIAVSKDSFPRVALKYVDSNKRPDEIIDGEEFIGIKGYSAKGKRLTTYELAHVGFIEPIKSNVEPEEEEIDEIEPTISVDEDALFKTNEDTPEQKSLF